MTNAKLTDEHVRAAKDALDQACPSSTVSRTVRDMIRARPIAQAIANAEAKHKEAEALEWLGFMLGEKDADITLGCEKGEFSARLCVGVSRNGTWPNYPWALFGTGETVTEALLAVKKKWEKMQ